MNEEEKRFLPRVTERGKRLSGCRDISILRQALT